jgi:hypothetical protein
MSVSQPNRTDAPKLVPRCPPGRSSRKARVFAAEIGRLHALGYTFDAIREALAEAGVHVSRSTVQREAARHAASGALAAVSPVVTAARSEPRSGKDVAETFVRDRGSTNPLIRKEPQR